MPVALVAPPAASPPLSLTQDSRAGAVESQIAQDPVDAWLNELLGQNAGRAERARVRLAEHADATRARLEARYRWLAKWGERGVVPDLVSILAAFRAMGPMAAGSIEFLAESVESVPDELWSSWKTDDEAAARAARDGLWGEMVRALGATGRPGFERMLAWAREGRRTRFGASYDSVLATIVPTGADSLAVAVEWALSADADRHRAGRMLVGHAGGEVAALLAARLDDPDRSTRRRATRALRETLPDGMPTLCAALESPDVEVRRLAAAVFAASSNVHQLDPNDPAQTGYRDWHGGTGYPLSRPFRILAAMTEPEAQAALVRALSDEDLEVRTSAAFVLCRLSALVRDRPSGRDMQKSALERTQDDPSPGVRYWAREALARRAEPDLRRLEGLARVAPHGLPSEHVVSLALELLERPAEFVAARPVGRPRAIWSSSLPVATAEEVSRTSELADRIEATVILAHAALPALRAQADGPNPDAAEAARAVLLAMESERAARGALLRSLLSRGGLSWGSEVWAETWRFGPSMLPELTAAYMQEPRFPIGWPTFESDFRPLLEPLGRAALPLYAEALWHWFPSGRYEAELWLGEAKPEPSIVLPLYLSRLRLELVETTERPRPALEEWYAGLPADLGAAAWMLPLLHDPQPGMREAAARCVLAAANR